jgi:uncharacterized protein YdcH (DUF465 family)
MDIHHPFVSEFPEHRETIRHLRLSDNKFRAMFEEYHRLDDEVCRIEEELEYATDQEIDELKFKRAKLKDALYSAVRQQAASVVPSGPLSPQSAVSGSRTPDFSPACGERLDLVAAKFSCIPAANRQNRFASASVQFQAGINQTNSPLL